ncbi:transposase [Aquimarina latercula]|uniref:transposase n=1 Tax=Aquimarina latercula TaxID=987 RepID=UPI001B7F9229
MHKSHNVSLLLYHLFCSTKHSRSVLSPKDDQILKRTYLAIYDRCEINLLEIRSDKDHVHFLLQSVLIYGSTKIARTIESITAREIFFSSSRS